MRHAMRYSGGNAFSRHDGLFVYEYMKILKKMGAVSMVYCRSSAHNVYVSVWVG